MTYSNEAKMHRLGVKAETLEKYGAVSEETAKEMAEGIARTSGADIGLATTGRCRSGKQRGQAGRSGLYCDCL